MRVARGTLLVAALSAVMGCHRERGDDATVRAPTPAALSDVALAAVETAETARSDAQAQPAPPDTFARADADTALRADAASAATDGIDDAPADPSNKTKPPLTSPDLEERAAHLLDAVARNEPAVADDFFFPKAPFIPLKDVADPGRYFDQLLATYHRDIKALHADRKDWTGVTFDSFELGTPPTWVAPGKEYNKIGYFRTFGGKLRYRSGEKVKELAVSTIISWNGRWYVTHLAPIRH